MEDPRASLADESKASDKRPKDRLQSALFKVRFGRLMQTDSPNPSTELIGKGEIELSGDEIRLRGVLKTPLGLIPRREVVLRWLQVVNVSRFDRMVSFDVISGAGADVERVEFLVQDEASARTIAQFLPDTTTGEQRGEAAHERSFEGRLQAIGGQAWVMAVLIGANVVAFVAASRAGGDVNHLDVAVMQKLGADYGPLTTHGQWWRLFTSMFLHFGVAHLWGNMWALWVGGRIVERLYGHLPFLMIYIAAGLCASLCSLLWHPADISAGASGAILGVWGAELAFFLRKDNLVPATIVLAKRYSTMVFIGVNLFYGLTHPGIDNSAHIGGLLAGFVLGLVLERPLIADREATSTPIFYLQGLLVAVLMVGGLFVAVRRWVAV